MRPGDFFTEETLEDNVFGIPTSAIEMEVPLIIAVSIGCAD